MRGARGDSARLLTWAMMQGIDHGSQRASRGPCRAQETRAAASSCGDAMHLSALHAARAEHRRPGRLLRAAAMQCISARFTRPVPSTGDQGGRFELPSMQWISARFTRPVRTAGDQSGRFELPTAYHPTLRLSRFITLPGTRRSARRRCACLWIAAN